MKGKELIILKENLERRFLNLIKNTNYKGLHDAEIDYLFYLFSEKTSSKVIENLIKKVRLNYYEKTLITYSYIEYMWHKTISLKTEEDLVSDNFNWKKIFVSCIPPFYSKYIDSQLHLQGKLYFFFEVTFKEKLLDNKYHLPTTFECKQIIKEFIKKPNRNSAFKIREYNGKIKLIDNYDTEISKFSCFHSSLIEEINDILKEGKESILVEEKKNLNKKSRINEEIILGPLSYADGIIYYKGSTIEKLTPQMVKFCKIFFSNHDEFISYETLQEDKYHPNYINKENMQKLISKIRKIFSKLTKKNLIKNVSKAGYIFEAKKIL